MKTIEMIASEEKPQKRKSSCSCCVPFLCACCAFQFVLCAILVVTLVLIGNFVINSSIRNSNHALRSARTYKYIRLDNETRPVHYNITLLPNLINGSFEGLVNITLKTGDENQFITLNSKNLTIRSAELMDDLNKTVINVHSVKYLKEDEVIVLNLTRKIGPGVYHLALNYTGNMLNKLTGLYLSRYKNEDNKTRTIATSKFEPTHARQAFPCFDEPNMKAEYTVHLWKPNDASYIALSNNPQDSEEEYNGGKLVHFKPTVSMSTYLSCFIVADFTFTETTFKNDGVDIPFRVYATPQQLEKTKYAGIVGQKSIEYFINYFNIPYPLPKLDMVAIPDFVSGAMEHWGLVTYRETALLYNKDTHSSANKQRVLTVVAHELSHSWFGNLVTMNWWDNLWLNEGFASYMQYKGGDAAEPDFGLLDQFLVAELHPVLNLDAKLSSHPIIQKVDTPDQITEVFDTISYNKGASILKMLEQTAGEENFKKGVTNYLNKHKYGNAVTQDLWNEIQDVIQSAFNVSEFMDTFTIQMGYPILNVTVEGNKYILTQKRFLINPDDESKQQPSPLGYKWTVPVTYTTNTGKSKGIIWFNKTMDKIEIERPKDALWMKFNYDQSGYYRVNYPEAQWKELEQYMLNLSIADRTHLLEEAFSIAGSGQLSYNTALDLTKYLVNETNYAPWVVASNKLSTIALRLKSTQYESNFKKYVINLLIPIYENVSWSVVEADSHLRRLNRVSILKLACEMEYEKALSDASKQLDGWFTNGYASPDLREIIYKYGMKTADQTKWDKMFNKFEAENDANEKIKLLNGLAAVNNPTLLTRLLELGKNENLIRSQDYFNFLAIISRNPIGTPLVWDYVRENYEDIVKRFTLNNRYLGSMIPQITSTFSTKIKLTEMEAFFAAYPDAGAGTSARSRALENVKNNIAWLVKYKEIVEKWIVANNS